ncbi:hypothetical protein [Negadavirga shengliensis]|uniref:Lipoprotein n=1 Tax=Negadavirga shengliensis TaxID=1389218 RepID=A0ABV9T8A0_9BACT
MKKILRITLMVSFLASCAAPITVKVNSTREEKIPMRDFNLASVMIGPMAQPVMPLVDAAAFNKKTNQIAHLIMDEEERIIEEYKHILVNTLNGYLSTQIVTSNQLDREIKSPYVVEKGIQTENKNFPIVFFSEGDLNIAAFGKGKNVNTIFKNDETLKARVGEIAEKMGISNIAVSYNRLAVVGAGAFGAYGTITLQSYLFVYDAFGNMLIDVEGWTKPEPIKGKDLIEYKVQLHKFEVLAAEMSRRLAEYIQKV